MVQAMSGIGIDFVNIGIGVLNYFIYKRLKPNIFKGKVNLAAAWICGGVGIGGLVVNLFKLALSLNETM